jgi:hypothetical protein
MRQRPMLDRGAVYASEKTNAFAGLKCSAKDPEVKCLLIGVGIGW